MAHFIDKDKVTAEIEKRKSELHSRIAECGTFESKSLCVYQEEDLYDDFLSFLDTLEVKEVIAEQECTCNEALNRIIGGNWNLLCPVNKLGLKTGDKVKVIIKAQKGE